MEFKSLFMPKEEQGKILPGAEETEQAPLLDAAFQRASETGAEVDGDIVLSRDARLIINAHVTDLVAEEFSEVPAIVAQAKDLLAARREVIKALPEELFAEVQLNLPEGN